MNSESAAPLDTLLEGIRRFRRDVYTPNRERYEAAMKKPQTPHTLVITCADSRIDPEALTQSGPGDIFVTRNIGNMVPAYGEMLGGVSAVIEYAVQALGVSQVVICGHTDCGAMKALLHPEAVSTMPTVKSWLRNGEAALSVVKSRPTPGTEPGELYQLIEENVLLQMQHLRTHPSVAGKIASGDLQIYGWVYDIGNGHVNMYDPATNKFTAVEHQTVAQP
jgi:carbonic anhydrase